MVEDGTRWWKEKRVIVVEYETQWCRMLRRRVERAGVCEEGGKEGDKM